MAAGTTTKAKRASSRTAETIERVAIELIHSNGYHGTSIRDIAGAADVGIATLFHHYSSKAEILRRMMNRGFDELLTAMQAAVAETSDLRERLARVVWVNVQYHCEHPMEASIVASELRSLDVAENADILEKRDRVLEILASALEDGVARGALDCAHPKETARAISAMCSGVTVWYREGDGLTAAQVADRYAEMALRMAGARARRGRARGIAA